MPDRHDTQHVIPSELGLLELIYGDQHGHPCRSLHARVEIPPLWARMRAALETVGHYNEYAPALVCEALEPVWARLARVEVGREHSPVLYCHLAWWPHQEIGWPAGGGMSGAPTPKAQQWAFAAEVCEALATAGPDEVSAHAVAGASNPHYDYDAERGTWSVILGGMVGEVDETTPAPMVVRAWWD